MFATDQAPGVYYQSVDAGSPPVTPLRTDITAFVGIAERGPVDIPVPIESWQQFASWFGGCTPAGYLAYAVRGFLENGGRRCWVVRVASKDPAAGCHGADVVLSDTAAPVWRVAAWSPGVWGDQLSIVVREANPSQRYSSAQDEHGRWSVVDSQAGFGRATLVRASQPGAPSELRVISTVDPATGRIYWTHPDLGSGLPSDLPLTGFDPDRPVLLTSVDYQLLVSERGRLLRVYQNLSLVPQHARYGPRVLAALDSTATASAPEPVVIEELRESTQTPTLLSVDPSQVLRLTGGRDGLAALTVDDFVGEPVDPQDSAQVEWVKRRGLRCVELLDEVGLLAVPDILIQPEQPHPSSPPPTCVPDPCLDSATAEPGPVPDLPLELPPVFSDQDVFAVQAQQVLQCEQRRDRFALLDVPYRVATDPLSGVRGALDWRAKFDTAFAALAYPWLKVADPVGGPGTIRLVPTCGHLTGLVAGTDLGAGVHRAPANRTVNWTLGPSLPVGEQQHAVLNSAGVNVTRTVGGRGLRLLGARTMSRDPDWRFINVRRLMSMIGKALGIAMQWAVFEPNGFVTRARATMSVTFFLDALHEQGMLAGATAEESFYVRCDLDNNPTQERELGRLLVEVGVAPVQPFEYVVLRVGRVTDSLQVREGGLALGAAGTGV